MPKGVALDKHDRAFQLKDKVVGPYGTATVVQIEKASDKPGRKVWLHNRRVGNHQVCAIDIVKI